MPRKEKPRTVCSDRKRYLFSRSKGQPAIEVTLDEFETLRLIDFEKLTQHECARMMGIARTTVQAIYERARYKLAEALLSERGVCVQGGTYRLCNHPETEVHCLKNRGRR
ncbi:MAG: DUF134 domain-containing protein [Acholeplasmataceae bacterium]